MKDRCRWCKHYMPDERYNGCVGWCIEKNRAISYDRTCNKMVEGTQHWLNGKEVKE